MRSMSASRKLGGMRTTIILVVVILLASQCLFLTSCGSKEKEEAAPAEERNVVGTYTAPQNITEELNSGLQETGSLIHIDGDVIAEFVLELREDSSFLLTVDVNKVNEELGRVLSEEKDSIVEALLEQAGITEDQYDAVAEASGFDSMDAFKDDVLTQTITAVQESITENMEEGINIEGTYRLEEDTIYLEAEGDEGPITLQGSIGADNGISIINSDGTELNFTKQ